MKRIVWIIIFIVLAGLLYYGWRNRSALPVIGTNTDVNAKKSRNLDYYCNLPNIPSDYQKDCDNFKNGFNSGLIR